MLDLEVHSPYRLMLACYSNLARCNRATKEWEIANADMLNEDKVPVADRCLFIEGAASPRVLQEVRAGLPDTWPDTACCLLVTYAYADLPLGKRFDCVFAEHQPHEFQRAVATINAATQQFGKPFEGIPNGWKTICLIDFPQGVPHLISRLRTVDAWGELNDRVLEAILQRCLVLVDRFHWGYR